MTPIYRPENCQSAFQLNWSVAVFGQHDFPPKLTWYEPLKTTTEQDGGRILEVHILLGCAVTESPESVALSLLNNLAFVQGMKPVYRFSYYVGTFGKYDRNSIRRRVSAE